MTQLKARRKEEAKRLFKELQEGDILYWAWSDGRPCYKVEIIEKKKTKYKYKALEKKGKETQPEIAYHSIYSFRICVEGLTDFNLYKISPYKIDKIVSKKYEI